MPKPEIPHFVRNDNIFKETRGWKAEKRQALFCLPSPINLKPICHSERIPLCGRSEESPNVYTISTAITVNYLITNFLMLISP
jgi:hypothetical protein